MSADEGLSRRAFVALVAVTPVAGSGRVAADPRRGGRTGEHGFGGAGYGAGPYGDTGGVVDRYDTDGDGTISIGELGDAAGDYARGTLTLRELARVAAAYASG